MCTLSSQVEDSITSNYGTKSPYYLIAASTITFAALFLGLLFHVLEPHQTIFRFLNMPALHRPQSDSLPQLPGSFLLLANWQLKCILLQMAFPDLPGWPEYLWESKNFLLKMEQVTLYCNCWFIYISVFITLKAIILSSTFLNCSIYQSALAQRR